MPALFPHSIAGIGAQRSKRALKECMIHYVNLAVLALHNPVTLRGVADASVGGDGFGLFTLGCVDDEWA